MPVSAARPSYSDYTAQDDLEFDTSEDSDFDPEPSTQDEPAQAHSSRSNLHHLHQGRGGSPQAGLQDLDEMEDDLGSREPEARESVDVEAFSSQVQEFKNDLNQALRSERLLSPGAKDSFSNAITSRTEALLTQVRGGHLSAEEADQAFQQLGKTLRKEISDQVKQIRAQRAQEKQGYQERFGQAMDLIAQLPDHNDPFAFSQSTRNVGNFAATWLLGVSCGFWVQAIGEAEQQYSQVWGRSEAIQTSTAIKNALETKDWTTVRSLLSSMDPDRAKNVMQYIVGALEQTFGEGEELTKALNVLPPDLRRMMAGKCLEKAERVDDRSNVGNRQKLTFHTPGETSHLISQSFTQENLEKYDYLYQEESQESSPWEDPETSVN